VAGPEPADKRHGALKGALLAVCATALAASATAACYGLRGWVVPEQQEWVYHLFLDTMVGLATVNQPDGTIAVLLFSAVAAVVVGALVGRTAAGAVGAPKERTSRIARAGVRNYVVAAIGIATALGALSTFLGGHFQWGLVFALVYGPIGAVVLLPLAIAPLVAAALLLERWTRPDCAAKTTSNIVMLLCLLVVLAVPLSMFAMGRYRAAAWTLTTSHSSQCSVTRGMSRGAVRKRCGGPTDLGMEANRIDWTLPRPRRCDIAVDAYSEHLVLYDCSQRVAGVELFAARGIHRVFKDDFDAQRAASVNPR